MNTCGDSSKVEQGTFQFQDGGSIPTSPLHFIVRKIDSKTGKDYIKKHHYSHGIHNGPICYGLFYNEILMGVCAFSTPCSENVCRSIAGVGNERQVIELSRLHLLDECPKNSESFFVSKCIKMLFKEKVNYNFIVSFADPTQGHTGVIYKALNFIEDGRTSPATFYVDENGRLRHPRQNGVNITRKEAESRGWKVSKRMGKIRFIYKRRVSNK